MRSGSSGKLARRRSPLLRVRGAAVMTPGQCNGDAYQSASDHYRLVNLGLRQRAVTASAAPKIRRRRSLSPCSKSPRTPQLLRRSSGSGNNAAILTGSLASNVSIATVNDSRLQMEHL